MSLLPLGSVIKIKNYKFCVIGYSSVDREQLVETGYLAVSYPLGFTSINKTVFIPKDNLPDLEDVDPAVKQKVRFIAVANVDEIITEALLPVAGHKDNSVIFNTIVPDSASNRISQ